MPQISAVVLCLNAAGTLAKCLRSLDSVADEIVLADSGSTDESLQIAAKAGARIIHLPGRSELQLSVDTHD
jgi:(heptosyl)LPS beta-1,4-glucosyltransferase